MNTLNKVIVSTNRISLTFCMMHCLFIAKDKLKLSMLCEDLNSIVLEKWLSKSIDKYQI